MESSIESYSPKITNSSILSPNMSQPMPVLRFVAQPKRFYRLRYRCEGRPVRNRAQRFVRADDNQEKYSYPTIEIPLEWITQHSSTFFIRLTHVTVPNSLVDVQCIHPYPIDSEDLSIIKDPSINSLYFPVTDEELITGRKSLHFTLYKLTQYELRAYGPLKLLNSDLRDDQRLDDPNDPRKIIDTYQLNQSRFICSIAVFQNNQYYPVIYDVSTVYSQIITAMTTQTNEDDTSVRCSPRRGDYLGREEILLVLPKVDKRRAFTIRFDHPAIDERSALNIAFVDNKTISLFTPPCPVLLTRENPTISIPIVVTQNDVELARIDFVYQSMDLCLNCNNKKRSFSEFEETDIISEFEKDIQNGNIEHAVRLIEHEQNFLEQENHLGQTPLLIAAKYNRNDLITIILKQRIDYVDQTDQQGNNLLHLLAQIPDNQAKMTMENIFTIIEGLSKELLVMSSNNQNQTPEYIAKYYGNIEYISLLR